MRSSLIVGLVAAMVFANALGNAFALDDNDVLLANPLVHRAAGLWLAFAHSYWPDATGAGQYRPLTMATFALDWAVFSGAPAWLHAVNVVWHVVVCVLVWRLLAAYVSTAGALLGALVFAVHPVHVEAVANLVGRSELLCAAFALGALLAHRRGHWVAVVLYAAALSAKETGITFLGLAVAVDLLLPNPAPGRSTGGSGDDSSHAGGPSALWAGAALRARIGVLARRRSLYIGYAGVTAVYAIVLAILFRDRPLVRTALIWQHATVAERWLTAARVIPEYGRLLLFPLHLHVDYSPRLIELVDRVTPAVMIGVLMVLGAVAIAVAAVRVAPVVTFAIALFAITIAPVANIAFPSGIILAERTMYLPSVSLALLVGWCVDRVAAPGGGPAGGDRRRAWAPRMAILTAVAGVLLVAFASRTWTRTPIWRNNKTVMIASLLGEPTAYLAHERAADVLGRSGDLAGALREYAVARSLYPADVLLYQAPAALLAGRGPSGAAAAAQLLDSARIIDPSPYQDALRRAWVQYAAGDYHGAIDWARAAYSMERDSVNAVMVLTQAAQQINDVSDARAAFRMALRDHPRSRVLHRSYGAMLRAVGDTSAARREEAGY